MYTLVTGDNTLILQTLKIGADVFSVAGLTVTARLVSKYDHETLTNEIACSDATSGADWANGIVAIVIPGTETENIDPIEHPEVVLETQVTDGIYDKTWFETIEIRKGTL